MESEVPARTSGIGCRIEREEALSFILKSPHPPCSWLPSGSDPRSDLVSHLPLMRQLAGRTNILVPLNALKHFHNVSASVRYRPQPARFRRA